MSDKDIIDILLRVKKFPCKLPSAEGKRLKLVFKQIPQEVPNLTNAKSLRFKYKKEFDGAEYFLIEEYLFNDRETILDINHAIIINYYLNKPGKDK